VWGNNCERIHDIFDECEVQLEIDNGREYQVMTTWHENESLDDALSFFLNKTVPNEEYIESCRTSFVVSVNNDNWADHLSQCLSDINSFNKRVAV
jgi:hypothetical protein